MITELFSFNWFLWNEDYALLKIIATIITHADTENVERLNRSYPVMVAAYKQRNWDIAPHNASLFDMGAQDLYHMKDVNLNPVKNPKQGSFGWYLNRSGSFVRSVAVLIYKSVDLNNIKKAYPQMVAAFLNDDWDEPPVGFQSDEYNADPV